MATQIHLHIVYGHFHHTTAESVAARETVWPTPPKVSTIWPFTENVCRPLPLDIKKNIQRCSEQLWVW